MKYTTRMLEVKNYVEEHYCNAVTPMTIKDMALHLGLKEDTLRKFCYRHNLKKSDNEDIAIVYIREGLLDDNQIKSITKVTKKRLKVLRKELLMNTKIWKKHQELYDYLMEYYVTRKVSRKEICEKFEINQSTLSSFLFYHNIKKNKYDYDAIKEDYKNGVKLKVIAQKYNVSYPTLNAILNRN